MRLDLFVPYSEKDAARKLGARWDGANKVWYIQDIEDITDLIRWIPRDLLSPRHNKIKKTKKKLGKNTPFSKTTRGAGYVESNLDSMPWAD
jgi:hypothetical protein